MTAPLQNLLACLAPPAPEGAPAPATGDFAALAADFSALLADLLPASPSAVPVPVTGAAAEEAEPEKKDAAAEANAENAGEEKKPQTETEATAVPVLVLGVPLQPVPTAAETVASKNGNTGGTGAVQNSTGPKDATAVAAPAVPLPEQATVPEAGLTVARPTSETSDTVVGTPEDQAKSESGVEEASSAKARPVATETAAANATLPLPAGFSIETNATAVPETTQADQSAAGAAQAAPRSGVELPETSSRSLGPNAELVFGARMSSTTPAGSVSQRPPELHIAMPHDLRTPEAAPGQSAGLAGTANENATPEALTAQKAEGADAEVTVATPPKTVATAAKPAVQAESGTPARAAEPASPAGAAPAAKPAAEPQSQAPAVEHARTEPERRERPETPREVKTAADTPMVQAADNRREAAASGATTTARGERASVHPAAGEIAVESAGESAAKPATPVREVSVVLPARGSDGQTGATPQIELRVQERTGEVQVAVRSTDTNLTQSLRENLGQLVSNLAERGYRTETWHPGGAASGDAPVVRGGSASSQPGGDSSNSGHSGRGGSDTAGREGNSRRDQQQQNQPEWMEALERSLGRGSASVRS